MHACDAGYVRSAPHASACLRMRSGTRASSTANDSDAWGSRCADLPATAAGSGIPPTAIKCSPKMEHCQMSATGGGMPPQSRAVTCIDSPDLAGHRLRAPDWPIHLDQLPASRVLAEQDFGQQKRYISRRRTTWLNGARHSAHRCPVDAARASRRGNPERDYIPKQGHQLTTHQTYTKYT